MTDDTDTPQGGTVADAPAPVADDVVDTNAAATPAQPDVAADDAAPAPDAGDDAAEPVKKVPWFQKRIDEVTAQKYEAQRLAEYYKGLAEGRTVQQPQTPQTVGPPQLEQFETYDDYEEAKIAFYVKQGLEQAKQQEQRQALARTHEERENAFRATKPDFDSVVRDPNLPITPIMAEVIRESDLGPEVAYHLGTNHSEAQRIAALSPARQAVEIGKIEAALTKAPITPAKPIPPAPPQTVGGVSAGLKKSMEEMSYAEFVAMREAEEKTR
jgi:hypothetical protein